MPAHQERAHRAAVEGITAQVKLWDGIQRIREHGSDHDDHEHEVAAGGMNDPDKLDVSVRLTALIEHGAPVASARDDFGICAWRRGVSAIWHRYRGPQLSEDPMEQAELLNRSYRVGLPDIEDAINQMLGRDPDQHRPPRLAWGNLMDALTDAGVVVTEQELIDAPLTIELSPEVKAQHARTPP